ncbi:M20/M25/M40 family metallo-hydrolase [Streptomyces sp. NPDC005840]|jgi:cysteinylglycine-S-conjugate dipeptidase|uniref:M20/M25/M40 family metallo-hydrolase n=1 Tax=unclassified Streptomyces TaxID=2593676 RepID=UPI0033326ECC
MPARPTATPVRPLPADARDDLAALVGLRTVAGTSPPDQFRRAARLIADRLAAAGLPEILLLPADDGAETVLARRPGPPGAPQVVLYAHYDVVSAQDETAWRSPPFELTERDGRWYGRGSADCKGNLVAHLTALRALRDGLPGEPFPELDLVVLADACEEPGDAALEKLLRARPGLLAPDVVVVADTGNIAPGVPTLTTSLRGMAVVEITVSTLARTLHSGQFGGPAPDALTALVRLLATLHDDDGTPRVDGLGTAAPAGPERAGYAEADFRADAGVLDGVRLLGTGPVAERLWDRPAVTVLAVQSPPLDDAVPALLPSAKALVSVRVPPGAEVARVHGALADHLRARVPWGARLDIERVTSGPAFRADPAGPAHTLMRDALAESFGTPAREVGAGGSIAVCSAFRSLYPDAEILLCGVEDPPSNIHGTDESVSPREIASLAHAEALFLRRLAAARTGPRPDPTDPREDR